MTAKPDLSFPIGPFDAHAVITPDMRSPSIEAIAALPDRLRRAIANLSDEQLDTAYRPGGWTVRQLVHHVADSHMNAYIRTKLALTENDPTIKPYEQDEWVRLADAQLPVDVSLRLLDALHQRWSTVWRSLESAQFSRTLRHPQLGALTLDTHLQLYGWHSRHHVAHITALREREGW
jgi:uncharacterized damage-inducible protein DinB